MGQDLASHYVLLLGLNGDWKVEEVALDMEGKKVRIRVGFRVASVACPGCGEAVARADFAPERTWRHLDTMQFETELRARVPRAACSGCGVKTCEVPWAGKHSPFTWLFEAFAVQVLESAANVKAAAISWRCAWSKRGVGAKRRPSIPPRSTSYATGAAGNPPWNQAFRP